MYSFNKSFAFEQNQLKINERIKNKMKYFTVYVIQQIN